MMYRIIGTDAVYVGTTLYINEVSSEVTTVGVYSIILYTTHDITMYIVIIIIKPIL